MLRRVAWIFLPAACAFIGQNPSSIIQNADAQQHFACAAMIWGAVARARRAGLHHAVHSSLFGAQVK